MKIDFREIFIIILILLCLTAVLFWKVVFLGQTTVASDLLYYWWQPWKSLAQGITHANNYDLGDNILIYHHFMRYIVDSFKQLSIPLWNPYILSGTSFLASNELAVFNPFNLFFLVSSFYKAFACMNFFQIFFAGFFMYLFLRTIGINRFASSIGSIIFMFNPFFMLWLQFEGVVSVCLWLPLALLFTEKIVRYRKYWFSLFLGAILGVVLLSGYLQISLYILLAVFIYAIVRTAQGCRYKEGRFISKCKPLLYIIVAFLLGFALSAVQLVPTSELVRICQRPKDIYGFKFFNLTSFLNLITSIFPDIFRNPVDEKYLSSFGYLEISYIGIFPLILVFLTLFYRRDELTFLAAAIGIVSLLVYLQSPLKGLIYFVPGYNRDISSGRIIILYIFSGSCLAAFGLDSMINDYDKFKCIVKKMRHYIIICTFIFLCLYLLGNFLLLLGKGYFDKMQKMDLTNILRNTGFNSESPPFLFTVKCILSDISGSYANWQESWSPFKPAIYLPFLLAGLSVVIFSLYQKKNNLLFKSAAAVIVIADLLYFGMKSLTFCSPKTIYPPVASVDFLKKDKSLWRTAGSGEIFPPNSLMAYQIQDISGCLSLFWGRYREFMILIDESIKNLRCVITYPSKYNSGLLNLLNVKYILSKDGITDSRFKLIYDKEIRIYENTQVLPRAFIVYKAKIITDKGEILQELKSTNFNPQNYVIIEEDAIAGNLKMQELPILPGESKINIVSYRPHSVIIDAELNENGFLILSDSYYPGWKAFVDKKETKVYCADYILRAVHLEKGKHRVEFNYNPRSFIIGKYISLSALAVFFAALAVYAIKKTKSRIIKS